MRDTTERKTVYTECHDDGERKPDCSMESERRIVLSATLMQARAHRSWRLSGGLSLRARAR